MKWQIIILMGLMIMVGVVEAQTTRTSTSNTYCDGGVCTLELHGGIINYWNDSEYIPINSTITVSDDELYEYMTVTGEYEIYFKNSLNTAETVKFFKDGVKTTFQPMQLYWTNDLDQIHIISMPQTGTVTPIGNMMNYEGAYGDGINLTYYYNNDNLKEDLTIINRSVLGNPAQYILDGGNVMLAMDFVLVTDGEIIIDGEKWDKSQDKYTNKDVWIENNNGTSVYKLKKPTGTDNELNITNGSYTFKKQGNKLYVSVKYPITFIDMGTYPIDLDPTIGLFYLSSGLYDVECRVNFYYDSNNDYITMGKDVSDVVGHFDSGIRFSTVTIPQDSTIDTAYIDFRAYNSHSGTVINTNIYAHDVDESAIFPSSDSQCNQFEARTLTTNFVEWNNMPSWTSGTRYDSPEIKTVIQEITDREGWISGNNLTIMMFNNNSDYSALRYFSSYEHGSSLAPILNVTYTEGGEPPAENDTNYVDCSTSPVTNESRTYNATAFMNGTGTWEIKHNITWEGLAKPQSCKIAVKHGEGKLAYTK